MKSLLSIFAVFCLATLCSAHGWDSKERPGFGPNPYPYPGMSNCPTNPCLNGARCYANSTNTVCFCQRGWTGANCETAIDYCNPNPCQNGAACTKVGYLDYKCECNPCTSDYVGKNCEFTNYCKQNSYPCQNGGECQNTNSSYVCRCPQGFNGTNCENQIDYCASAPCKNGGQCQKWGFFDYKCVCSSNYTGKNCELINYCKTNGVQPCQNGGTCENNYRLSSYKCYCPLFYSGINCETLVDYCKTQNPCRNGATCQSCFNNTSCGSGEKVKCTCAAGFTGNACAGYLSSTACNSACGRFRRCSFYNGAYYC